MPELLSEVGRFRSWAAAAYPNAPRYGEWECDYEHWRELDTAVLEFIARKPFPLWSPEEVTAVIYAVARDNEIQYLSRTIREHSAELLLDLAEASLDSSEPDASWQFAEELAHIASESARRETLLLAFAHDDHEYVRRRALRTLARIGSRATEQIALEAWSRPNESQQWSRRMALWALNRVRSEHLPRLLTEAEQDADSLLSEYAGEVRRGEVEP